MRRAIAHGQQWAILTFWAKLIGTTAAKIERLADGPEFWQPFVGAVEHGSRAEPVDLRQCPASAVVVHGSPVVGIHQPKRPQLRALLEIGNPRRRQRDQHLRQRRDSPRSDLRFDASSEIKRLKQESRRSGETNLS